MKLLQTIWEEQPGQLSWARVFSSVTVLVSLWSLIHIVWKTNALPAAADLLALGTFAGFPYSVNKIAGALDKKP